VSTAIRASDMSMSYLVQFVEYERMVYLEPDMQVLDNIDELEKGSFYAVMDCYCEQCPDKVSWPAPYFNSGMFVHVPSVETAKALLPPAPLAEQQVRACC
jgi:inositol 3-alpha-galactosyltransferase